jgi:hypothetical protein
MEKFDINELLRYVVVGTYFLFLTYITCDHEYLKTQIDLVGKKTVAAAGFGLTLLFGTLFYILYRALLYPWLNFIVTSLTQPYRSHVKSTTANDSTAETIEKTDEQLWKSDNEKAKDKLSEWASQVHYLYNFSFISLFVWIEGRLCKTFFISSTNNFIYLFFGFMLAAIIHHIRYKNKESRTFSKT